MPRPHISTLAVAALAACVTSTTIDYLPSPEQPRLPLAEGRAMLARFAGLECDRLREAGLAEAATELIVVTDTAGLATSATLRRSTGDARMDGVVGAISAQLDLGARGAGGARNTLHAGYRCADGGVSATLELR